MADHGEACIPLLHFFMLPFELHDINGLFKIVGRERQTAIRIAPDIPHRVGAGVIGSSQFSDVAHIENACRIRVDINFIRGEFFDIFYLALSRASFETHQDVLRRRGAACVCKTNGS
jgi:hypothetical protein